MRVGLGDIFVPVRSPCTQITPAAPPPPPPLPATAGIVPALRGTFSTVLFGVGVAAIGTGTVMYLLAKHSGTTVSPHVGESNAGVTLSGNF